MDHSSPFEFLINTKWDFDLVQMNLEVFHNNLFTNQYYGYTMPKAAIISTSRDL
jgi:hypothetical protein